MIPSGAVKKYIAQKRDNHLWMKSLDREELQAAIDRLKPKPELFPKLHNHQLACFLLGVSYPQFCFWLDMGLGKTLITLELIKYWWKCGRMRRVLVFVRSDKAFTTWEKQIKRYDIGVPYVMLDGSSTHKWQQLDEFVHGIVILTYPGAVALVSKTVRKKRKNKWTLDPDRVARLAKDVDAIVLDESTSVAGHGSLAHWLVEKLGNHAKIRYALAGRPFGRDPTLLWAQHYLVDGGASLGPTLGMFRAAFFTDKPNPFVPVHRQKYIREYVFDRRKEPILRRMLQHRSIAYEEKECLDVPKFTSILEEVSFPEEAAAYYQRAIKTIIESKGNARAVSNIFLRMRQLSSGFMGFMDDDTGEKAQVEFEENPKLDRLLELLEELPVDRKAVVFYDFTWSGRLIAARAKEMGLNPIWVWAGTKDYRTDIHNFETKPQCRLAVVQNKVGAYSLDELKVANYCFFYESPVSVIDREQAEKRLRRQGQTRRVFQFDLVVRGSMDARILYYHQEGEDMMKALLRDPQSVLKGM